MAAIRAALVKGRSSGDEVHAAAEETTTELRERICQLHQLQKQASNGSGTGISPARVMYSLCSQYILLAFVSSPNSIPSDKAHFIFYKSQTCELTER